VSAGTDEPQQAANGTSMAELLGKEEVDRRRLILALGLGIGIPSLLLLLALLVLCCCCCSRNKAAETE